MFDYDIHNNIWHIYVCLSTICLADCLYFVSCLSFCSDVCFFYLSRRWHLAYILLFLSFIFYYGFISMENMLLFYLYKAHIMNDHTLNVFLTVCYRRAVAVSSCRPACLHVSFCLCLQSVYKYVCVTDCLYSVWRLFYRLYICLYVPICPDDIH